MDDFVGEVESGLIFHLQLDAVLINARISRGFGIANSARNVLVVSH